MTKVKVLLLGTHDSKMAGHIQNVYNQIKDYTEANMVTRLGFYEKSPHCYWPLNGSGLSFWDKIRYFRFSNLFFYVWRLFYCLIRFFCIPVVDKNHPEYSFGDFEFLPYTAKDIINKCPVGFVPDVIFIGWSSRFISAKIIHDLYQMTGAKIVYSFVDEAPMTGGCHYPNDCKEYLKGCRNCPALSSGKKLASAQMRAKVKYLKDIPMCLTGSPYDMRLAKETELFRNSILLPGVYYPKVKITPRLEARKVLGIPEDRFVVLLGATNLENVRKGFVYSINSINILRKKINNLFLLVIGSTNENFRMNFPDTEILELGFVETNKMLLCYCAADCFLSTTIADSGPQMVNYSIATGTPVVSFSIGIAQDLVIHKETGYLASFKDSSDVANGLEFLYGLDEEQQQQMSERCINLIKNKSSVGGWEQVLLS